MATFPITDTPTRNDYSATAAQTTFPYTFWIKEEDHLDVYVNGTLKVLTTDYTVSDTQSVTGANVVFNSGLAEDDAVAIVYNPDFERATGFSTGGSLRANTLNLELTYLLSLLQYLDTQLGRAIRVEDSSDTSATLTVPDPEDNAGKFLAYDGTGNLTAVEGSADGVTVSTFGATLIDDANAAAARTTLGLGSAALLNDTNSSLSGLAALASVLNLTYLAGQTAAANKLPYFDGTTSMATTDLTAFARTLLDDADAAAARTTLGVPEGRELLHIQHTAASGGFGGAASAATWNTRALNTVVTNDITGASLSSNRITLPAGTYEIQAWSQAFLVDAHCLRLRNIDDSTTDLEGQVANASSSGNSPTNAYIFGKLTIAAEKDFELQHYTSTARATNGLGTRMNVSGTTEIFSDIVIWKVG